MNNKIELKFGALIALIIVVALARLIPNMPNFSPMAAVALFCAAHFDKLWKAILVTLLATFVSDVILNNTIYSSMNNGFTFFYDGFIWQYLAYIAIAFLGSTIFNSINKAKVLGASITSTLIFFLISNFGAWISLPFYSKDLAGLMASYTAGLPFLKNTLLSDLFYTSILFGVYYLLQNRFESIRLKHLKYA
jgi:hypothetical protein